MIDLHNSTKTLLGANETFIGKYTDITPFCSISIIGSANVNGTLYADFSIDGYANGYTPSRTLQLSSGTTTDFGIHCLIPVTKFFRIRIVNGSTPQSSMNVQTIHYIDSRITIPTSRNNQTINDYTNVINTRSILVGETSGGIYKNVSIEPVTSNLKIALPKTAFGHVSCSLQQPVIQINFIYNINTDIVNTTTTGIGSVSQSASMALISTGAQGTSSAKVSSKRVIKYRAGQGCHISGTALFTTGVVGSTQLFGVGNDIDGMFFGYNGETFGVLHRNNSVDTWIAQTSWNGDKMDGDGDTAQILDPTKGNVYFIQYQWLGFGMIKFAIEDSNTGDFVIVHIIKYANTYTTPSLLNPVFPIIWEAKNTSNTSNIIVKGSSAGAEIEGNITYLGPKNSIGKSKTGITTTLTNIITIRNKTTFASATNNIPVLILKYSGAVDATKVVEYKLILNTTLGGTPSYTDISVNTSVVDYDTAGTTITGGTILDFGTLAKADSFSEILKENDLILQPGDKLTFAIRATNGTADVSCAFRWIEDV